MVSDAGGGKRQRERNACRTEMLGKKKGGKKKEKKHNTRQSDTTIISIAGERGAVRER